MIQNAPCQYYSQSQKNHLVHNVKHSKETWGGTEKPSRQKWWEWQVYPQLSARCLTGHSIETALEVSEGADTGMGRELEGLEGSRMRQSTSACAKR